MTVSGSRLAILLLASLAVVQPLRAGDEPWTYSGAAGPAAWGDLDPAFASCELGQLQSPIDIHGAKTAPLPAIRFDYRPSPLRVIDNGHTIQVNLAPGSAIEVGEARYELLQFHFHHPSEEKVDGKAHAMVAHLVHKGTDGKLAVVAVLLDAGKANPTIETIWSHLPEEKGKEVVVAATIDAATLLPENRRYYTFQGSLTTPPCSEGVRWLVLQNPVTLAEGQLTAFARLYPMNARPVQPLHGREILASP